MNDIPVRTTAGRTARRLADHPSLRRLARAGFAASGLIHLMLGWIAGRAAVGGGGEADQDGALAALEADPEESSGLDGALKTLAAQPLGTALLLAVAAGLALYGLYSFARARYADL